MSLAAVVISSALTVALLWAATKDVMSRSIPNRAVLAVLGLFVLWAAFGLSANLFLALAVGAGMFALGYGLWSFKIFGAGDAKLLAACSLFAGAEHLSSFILATVLTGGLMAVASYARNPSRLMMLMMSRGTIGQGRGIPYGAAIATGGVLVQWLALAGALQPFTTFGLAR